MIERLISNPDLNLIAIWSEVLFMFQLEKTKKESARKAYFDSEKAEAARAEGNEFFKKGKFPEAIKCYDEGMKRTPDDDKVKMILILTLSRFIKLFW